MLYIIRIAGVKDILPYVNRAFPMAYKKFVTDVGERPYVTVSNLRGLDHFEYQVVEQGYSKYMRRKCKELNDLNKKFGQ